jgi:hypothetical protein
MYPDQAEVHLWHGEALGHRVVKALKKNDFDAIYFAQRDQAVQHILDDIPKEALVAIGGSVTLHELGLVEKLNNKCAELITIHGSDLSAEKMVARMRKQLTSDVFLSSVNAITLDGFIVNVDSAGNRTAAMTFGPRRVILVAGTNKICRDIDSGFGRIRMIAAPKNNRRINLYKRRIQLDNPCSTTGICMDCKSKTRICRIYTVMKRKPMFTDLKVVLVGEDIGF